MTREPTLLEDLERAASICRGVRAWMSGPEAVDMATVGDRLLAHAARLREEMEDAEAEPCDEQDDVFAGAVRGLLERINGGPLP